MPAEPKMGRMGQAVLWVLPLVVLGVAVFAAIPWLQTISQPIAILITAAVVIFGMSYGNYLGYRAMRGLDEVEKAGADFAAQWGAPLGHAAFCLLLVLPPFQNFMTAVVSGLAAGPGRAVDVTVVVTTLSFGFFAIVLLESVGRVIVQVLWWTFKR